MKSLYADFDDKKAQLIALHHDNHEIVLEGGDIPLQLKLMMNEQESNDLRQKELSAIDMMSHFDPKKVKGYEYKQLSLHAVYKDCIEAQFVSFVDKVDGYCEAIHEVLAGNTIFLEPIINYDFKSFGDLLGKFPLLEKSFNSNHEFFKFQVVDLKGFFKDGAIGSHPHDSESIKRKTEIHHYEFWKQISINNFGINSLIKQTEFHTN
jgi:5'-deoxynucleotidase YfbR-like HD superfamily hydrolase